MLIDPGNVSDLATQTLIMRQAEQDRLRHIDRYMRGRHDPPYAPRGVNAEYRWIMKKSRRNFLPLVVSVISQNLHVDGYRPTGTTTNQIAAPQAPNPTWDAFRANRLTSRQHGVHRSVCKYGSAYLVVLPGELSTDEELEPDDVPVMRPVSPRRMTALYADDVDDEWPQFAIEVNTRQLPGNKSKVYVSVYDEQYRYILASNVISGYGSIANYNLQPAERGDPMLNGQDPVSEHGLGLCPVVRFLHEQDLDGEMDCAGEVEPLLPIQDQINFDTFNLMMAEQYGAVRQRYVTGMAPVDEQGREQAPFRPGVDRMLAAEDPNTHFGEFSETPLQPFSTVREDGIRHMSTVSQVPPYHLLGQVANLSADALAAARDGLDRKVEELQSVLTDPWRNCFRLAGKASNDKETWNDLYGSVVWRNTSAKAFASTVLGLTQIASMLGVPEQELWQFIPGVTSEDVAAWQLAAQRAQAQQLVQQLVSQAQAGAGPAAPPGSQPPQSPPPAQGVPGQTAPMPPGQTAPGGTPANAPLGPGGSTPPGS